MNIHMHFFLFLFLNLSIVFFISFSFGVIIKHHTKIKALFYFPLGFLVFLGISYILSFPFIYFKWQSFFYYLILFSLFLIAVIYSIRICIKYKYYRKPRIERVLFSLCALIFISFAIVQTTKYSLSPEAFDSIFYNSFVINNVNKAFLGWHSYAGNTPLNAVNTQYDFSSYYYVNSFLLIIDKSIFSNINELLYSPLYIWQSSIMLFTLSVMTVINVFYIIFKKASYSIFLLLFSIICLFYGSLYFNNALAFIGNSYRPYIVANIFIGLYSMSNKHDSLTSFDLIIISLMNASLIAVSSSGFFISAFIVYGTFYALIRKDLKTALKSILIISVPTTLYFYAYLCGAYTLILSPLTWILLYMIDYFYSSKLPDSSKVVNYLFTLLLPLVITLAPLLFPQKFSYSHSQFFISGGAFDMVWDYFEFPFSLLGLINIIIILMFCFFLLSPNHNESFIVRTIRIIFITFLNPLVIPFTIRFFTSFVFYRAFDIFFNPFIYALMIETLITTLKKYLRMEKIIILGITVPFTIFGLVNFSQYYHYSFQKPANYDAVLKQTPEDYEMLEKLYYTIKLNGDKNPIIVSQITHTFGYVPDIIMPYSSNNWVAKSSNKLTKEQAELLNIIIYSQSFPEQTIDGMKPIFEDVIDLLIINKVDYAIINKNSYYYDFENDEYTYLYSVIYDYFDVIYYNDQYILFKINSN